VRLITEFVMAVPWFLPGLAVGVPVILAITPRAARALAAHRLLVFAVLMALGVVILATLTPTSVALAGSDLSAGFCDLGRLGLPPRSELLAVHDTLRNVMLFVPLGFTLGLLPRNPRTGALIVVAYALPFAIEMIQLAAPAIGRGCQSADVIDNAIGLTAGLIAGSAAGYVWRQSTRRRNAAA